MMKRITTTAFAVALGTALNAVARAETDGVRVTGSRLPNVLMGIGVIALGVFLFAGMLAGRQKREVVVTPTGLPIPIPLIPLAMGVLLGVYLITSTPPDSYVLNGVRYSLSEDSAAAVGFAKNAEVPDTLELPARVDGLPLTKVGGFGGSGVREVILPGSVGEIENNAFKLCASLEVVRIVGASGKPLVVGPDAFLKCTALETLEGFNHIDEIRANAFYGCTSLVQVEMAGQESGIGQEGFRGCTALRSVTLTGRWKIGSEAFRDCKSLESLMLEDSHEIYRNAFKGCPNVVIYTDSSWAITEASHTGVKIEHPSD